MSDTLTVVFNVSLDITAAFSITVQSTAIAIVLFCTPSKMRSFSYFILNEMGWTLQETCCTPSRILFLCYKLNVFVWIAYYPRCFQLTLKILDTSSFKLSS
ncbi:hypothetical protein L596_026560 [Steinernema carpocapsae]|uniref:Uncharacterized protein n=1 Tax=Steinernema carpocapsae TaxID=34508 RepID=A0A4U5M1R3_STECR|nr:hypothetical protein L596_026560 [Steinernema carpocapsae]